MPELSDYKVNELKYIADELAVELDGATKKSDIIEALIDQGVTMEMVKEHVYPDVEEDDEVVAQPQRTVQPKPTEPELSGDTLVIKMTRNNKRWDAYGEGKRVYTFTNDHPYVIVPAEDADRILDEYGFRLASPKEVREYYG